MTNQIVPFQFETWQVRVKTLEGVDGPEPWFVLTDVCRVLGISNARNVAARLDDDMKGVRPMDTPGGPQNLTVVSEAGLYEVIIRSDSPNAKPFRRWVTSEVLPSIRKTGSYGRPSLDLTNLDSISAILDAGKAALNRALTAEAHVKELAPKAAFADAVSASHTSILVGELAKIMRGNGLDIGQNRLFERLRNDGYLIKREGTDYNMPTQKSMDLGLFKIKETAVRHSDGHVTISRTPKVTGKGQTYFIERYLSRELAESEAV